MACLTISPFAIVEGSGRFLSASLLHAVATAATAADVAAMKQFERSRNTLIVLQDFTFIRPISAASVRASYFSACARIWCPFH